MKKSVIDVFLSYFKNKSKEKNNVKSKKIGTIKDREKLKKEAANKNSILNSIQKLEKTEILGKGFIPQQV